MHVRYDAFEDFRCTLNFMYMSIDIVQCYYHVKREHWALIIKRILQEDNNIV